MEIKIDIKSIFGDILFSFSKENNTIKDTLLKAYLEGANLRDADLRNANLRDVNLRGVNLRGANLRNADLRDVNLSGASLSWANLRGADLRGADLRNASLSGASLRVTVLNGVNFSDADLSDTDLSGASLSWANLNGANLNGADYSDYTSFLSCQCPIEGSFIGWKKCGKYIIKLKICDDADRSSSTSLKCRCSKADVLEIQNLDGSIADITEISPNNDEKFIYKVGETVEVEDFDKNRWNDCSTGIHFFIDRDVAVLYK